MMKTLILLIAALMLMLSAPVVAVISAQSPQALARNMDDVQSLGVIYINRNGADAPLASPASETPEDLQQSMAQGPGISPVPRL